MNSTHAETMDQTPSTSAPETTHQAMSDAPSSAQQRSLPARLRESMQINKLASLPRKRLVFGLGVVAAVIAVPMALHRWKHAQHRRLLNAALP